MKRKLLYVFFILIFGNKISAQSPLVKQWDKRFGGKEGDNFYSFKQTIDGGYILGGASDSDSSGDKTQPNWDTTGWIDPDYWIVKIDSLGTKKWDKRFGGNNVDALSSLQQTTDKGFILGGWSNSEAVGDKSQPDWDLSYNTGDYWVVKIDSLGNKQWDKRFGGTNKEFLGSLLQTNDGGYLLAGRSASGISGDKTQVRHGAYDYWIVKIDSAGNKQWDKDFGGNKAEYITSLEQTDDGGYIIGGYSNSDSSFDKSQNDWDTIAPVTFDYWIIKIDSSGNKQWDKRYGGTEDDLLTYIQKTTDGGYILGGQSNSGISGDKTQALWGQADYWIVKIDSVGNKLWDKDFGGLDYEEFYSICITSDNGILFCGDSYSNIGGDKTENNLGTRQTWIIKTDSNGIKQWDKTIFTSKLNARSHLIQSFDSCFVIVTTTTSGIGGYKTEPNWDTTEFYPDYWIIKFCDTTLTTSIYQINNSGFQVSIYPNPTNTILNLFVNIKENIIITNLLGEIVLQKTAEGKVELDVSFLSAGIYFIRVGNEVRKFVKE